MPRRAAPTAALGSAWRSAAALERGARRSPYPQTIGALADALKLTPDERAAFADAATAHRRAVPRPQSPALGSPPELRLMLVDDEDLFRDLLQTALGQKPR